MRAAQGSSHEENDNSCKSDKYLINILGVSEDGDRLLTTGVDFKHLCPSGVSVQELGQGGLLIMFCFMEVSGAVRWRGCSWQGCDGRSGAGAILCFQLSPRGVGGGWGL